MLIDFVEYIAKRLVERPDDVQVALEEQPDLDHYTLSVAKEDIGKVIGKEGRNAKAMRTLLTAASARRGRKAILDIADDR